MNTEFDVKSIPQILREAGWHVWDGKTKRPRIPAPAAPYAKPHQARPFMECVHFAESRRWGIGVQMASTKFVVGIDLDRCLPMEDWAQEIVDCADSGVFLTPSGTGLRLFVHGLWKGRGREWVHPDGQEHHGFGVYPSGQTRFLTIGRLWKEGGVCCNQPFIDWLVTTYFPVKENPQQSAAMEDIKKIAAWYERCFPDSGVVPHMMASRCQFGKLWRGDWSAYSSQSEADLALANHLAFEYVGPNPERLETLMTVSELGRRDKWVNRDDYRDWTIEKAIKGYLNSPVFISDLVRARK